MGKSENIQLIDSETGTIIQNINSKGVTKTDKITGGETVLLRSCTSTLILNSQN